MPSVELVHVDGTEDDLLAASLYESAGAAEAEIRRRIAALDPIERAELIGELAGERRNRRHRPGRGWEAVRYRFEIVSDYGGFRDLQRHRMLTCQWQRLGPELGAGVPEEVREAGAATSTSAALEVSRPSSSGSRRAGMAEAAPYALCLGYRIRYVLDLNAREAMHLCELRSGREGHPTYRAVAQAMHERIAGGPPGGRRGDAHVDSSTEPRLERILSEIRTHRKRVAAAHTADAPPGVSSLGLRIAIAGIPTRSRIAPPGPDHGSSVDQPSGRAPGLRFAITASARRRAPSPSRSPIRPRTLATRA